MLGISPSIKILVLSGQSDEANARQLLNHALSFLQDIPYADRHVSEATSSRQNPQRTGLGDVPLAVAAP